MLTANQVKTFGYVGSGLMLAYPFLSFRVVVHNLISMGYRPNFVYTDFPDCGVSSCPTPRVIVD